MLSQRRKFIKFEQSIQGNKMSSKKNDDDKIDSPNSQTQISNKIQVYKDPLFNIGDIVKHRIYPFRGVIVDVDPEFSNTEEWYQSIPAEIRPSRNQPYYHLMAENTETFYTAYVSQQNLVDDGENGPLEHPDLDEIFSGMKKGKYHLRNEVRN